ncbi:MAG: hypothetical protein N2C14_18940 [Planctomycetales bacterium]
MANDNLKPPTSSDVPVADTEETLSDRRSRLAHLIGRLLARTWLRRRAESMEGENLKVHVNDREAE